MGAVETETTIVKAGIGFRKIEVTGPQYKVTMPSPKSPLGNSIPPIGYSRMVRDGGDHRCQLRNRGRWNRLAPGVACSYRNSPTSTNTSITYLRGSALLIFLRLSADAWLPGESISSAPRSFTIERVIHN